MKIVSSREFLDTVIGKEYLLEPDEDLERAISFEEFVDGAKKHIRELYSQRGK